MTTKDPELSKKWPWNVTTSRYKSDEQNVNRNLTDLFAGLLCMLDFAHSCNFRIDLYLNEYFILLNTWNTAVQECLINFPITYHTWDLNILLNFRQTGKMWGTCKSTGSSSFKLIYCVTLLQLHSITHHICSHLAVIPGLITSTCMLTYANMQGFHHAKVWSISKGFSLKHLLIESCILVLEHTSLFGATRPNTRLWKLIFALAPDRLYLCIYYLSVIHSCHDFVGEVVRW